MKRVWKISLWGIGILFALSVLGAIVGPRNQPVPTLRADPLPSAIQNFTNPSLEVQLATLHMGQPTYDSDPTVARFRMILDSIERKTINSRQDISDVIVRAWELLRRDVNADEKLLDVAIALDRSIPQDASSLRLDLKDVAALYVTLRMKR